MDVLIEVLYAMLVTFGFCSGGVSSSQLYLQPSKTEHGYFTNDSFFITCFTTDNNIEELKWIGTDENTITDTQGRIHIQAASGAQQGLELVVESVQKQDEGQYVCSDMLNSISFNLIVYRSISFSDTPKVQYAYEGEDATITCKVKSDHTPMVSWVHNEKKIETDEKYKITDDGIIIYKINRSDAGQYQCRALATTHLGSQNSALDIMVHVQYAPEWLEDQKAIVYARIGVTANLSCLVSADPPAVFQWIKDGVTIHNSSDYMIFNSENGTMLQMTVQSEDQFAKYVCRASNKLGSKEKTVELSEGDAPGAPTVNVVSGDKGTIVLAISAEEDIDNELKVTGFRVQYSLKTDPNSVKKIQEFFLGEQYVLQNVSYNSEYMIQVAAQNAAGYGNYSDEITYQTEALESPFVVSSSTMTARMASALLILVFFVWI